ncbi:MAG: response regulator [Acidobacteriia bacterium]|nr:response regulator [Terriglobia bacterium]
MLERFDANDACHAQVIEIKKASDRAASLTRQLLTFSRREVLSPQVLDLNATVANIQNMLRRLIGEDILLVNAGGSDLESVKVDPGQIEQVILNLGVNARDAMPHGGTITIETANVQFDKSPPADRLSIPPGPYVLLAVRDTGGGMDAETQSHIFEPFFTTKEKGKGTGLGLAVVYGIVQQSGGHVRVSSELGKGTTFRIYLPAIPKKSAAELPKAGGDLPVINRGSETVLVVEDEETVRSFVTRVLQARGCTVLVAADPEQAVTITKEYSETIHLLLTDVVMPILHGHHLAKYLGFWCPNTKVLYMSGYVENPAALVGSEKFGASFLPKPFTAGSLVEKVRQLLDARPEPIPQPNA